jgi:hypothetical protein
MRKYERSEWIENVNCNFCGTKYTPKRRFVQKYCSESCRVMACRERKNGYLVNELSGIDKPQDTKNMITNARVLTELNNLKTDIKADLKTINSKANYLLLIDIVSLIKQFFDTWALKKVSERNEDQLRALQFIIKTQVGNNKKDLMYLKEMVKQLHPKISPDLEKLF